jgi:diguanylate cyclase (GGDEF)-like protein
MFDRLSTLFRKDQPAEDENRRIFVLLHGLLMAFAAYAILTGLSGTFRVGSFVVIGLAALFQGLIYVLPDGYMANRHQQRRLIVLGVLITAGWLFPLSLDAEPVVWVLIVAILVTPLIIQRVTVWIACTAVAIATVVIGREAGWLRAAVMWETEFLVVQLFLVVWLIFAFLFDSLKLLANLKKQLQHERTQARVLSDLSSRFLAAEDAHDVFLGVTQALDEILGGAECLMIRVNPLEEVGTVIAASESLADQKDTTIAMGENSPLQDALNSGEVLSLLESTDGDATMSLAITANSGLGAPLLISCRTALRILDPEILALIEKVADAAARTIRNVEFLNVTREKAQTDALTSLPNRRSFQTNLRREFERAERHQRPLSLLMIDLDFLKSINDEYGHPVGDSVIRTAAQKIVSASRYSDYQASRYGGEEFAVILPETDLEGAIAAGERICQEISSTRLPNVRQFTASVGAACYPVNASSQESLVEAADEALYVAKRTGRNQVIASDTHTLV